MTDIVLVHGGAHGAWCWQPLIAALEANGHRGFAFDLPGHGDDPTPRATVTLSTYIEATERFIDSLQLGEFMLFGHSIAGMVISEVATKRRRAISELVYLSALVLDRGQRGIDLIPEERRQDYFDLAAMSRDNTLSVPFAEAHARFFNDLSEAEARRWYARLTPQPLAPYLQAATVAASEAHPRRRFIVCCRDQSFARPQALSMARRLGGSLDEIDSDHDAMLSHPRALAELLLSG